MDVTRQDVQFDIEMLADERCTVARLNETLVEMEYARKVNLLALYDEYRAQGKTQKDADDLARTDARYKVRLDEIVRMTRTRDEAMARAEALGLSVELDIALLRRVAVEVVA